MTEGEAVENSPLRPAEGVPPARRRCGVAVAVALAGSLSLGGCRGVPPPDKELFEETCARCHSLDVPLSHHKSEPEWRKTVWAMRQRGAPLTDEEAERLVRYLAQVRPDR